MRKVGKKLNEVTFGFGNHSGDEPNMRMRRDDASARQETYRGSI